MDKSWKEIAFSNRKIEDASKCDAANDATYAMAPCFESDGSHHLLPKVLEVLEAPSDVPEAEQAIRGLSHCLESVASTSGVGAKFIRDIRNLVFIAPRAQAPGVVTDALMRRKQTYLVYEVALQIGHALAAGKELDSDAVKIYGLSALCRTMGEKNSMGKSTLARLRSAIVNPTGSVARAWTKKARARALSKAQHALQNAVQQNTIAAQELGFAVHVVKPAQAMDAISVLNRAFRRRTNNLIDYATEKAISGADGNGTLSLNSLRACGEIIRSRIEADEPLGILIGLEVISHLPAQTAQLLPIAWQGIELEPDGCLVWLDLTKGTYNYRLFHLDERGARPRAEAADLYETTSRMVSIQLPEFLLNAMRKKLDSRTPDLVTVSDLLGPETIHHPRAAIDDAIGYRHTVRRLQESLPAHLLQQGMMRWPVALATNSLFLVSRGRRAYGACHQSDLNRVINEQYRLLGWPRLQVNDGADTLVGSFVTPKREAIKAALDFLAKRATQEVELEYSGVVRAINQHAAWMAALLCLALALRKSIVYELPQRELREGDAVHVNDKDVHDSGVAPVPVTVTARRAVEQWRQYCETAVLKLSALEDPRGESLAGQIKGRLNDSDSLHPVFTVDAAGRLQGIGTDTWHSVLPPSLQLIGNFGRHFFPLQLMREGIEQLLIDTLMRHQVSAGRPGASTNTKVRSTMHKRLASAMEKILHDLDLQAPWVVEATS